MLKFYILIFAVLVNNFIFAQELLVYKGEEGPGKGKHIVFLASDHEYRSEETCPAIARILAKNYGFTCTVLFGVDDQGKIIPGSSKIPGMEQIKTADLVFVFARFLEPDAESMQYFADYIDKGGPIVGLRTSTHAFKIGDKSPFKKYNFRSKEQDWEGGFGRKILGETWVSHYGTNHKCATAIKPLEAQLKHPVMTGVGEMHVLSGGYTAKPVADSTILAEAIVLETMEKGAKPLAGKVPQAGIWLRSYEGKDKKVGRVFASTHGASEDILDDNFRRCIINGVFWTMQMEEHIKADMNIAFVGPYKPSTFSFKFSRLGIKPLDIQGYDSTIWNDPKN